MCDNPAGPNGIVPRAEHIRNFIKFLEEVRDDHFASGRDTYADCTQKEIKAKTLELAILEHKQS